MARSTSLLLTFLVAANQILVEVPSQHYKAEQDDDLQLWLRFKAKASRVSFFNVETLRLRHAFFCFLNHFAFVIRIAGGRGRGPNQP